MINICTNGTQFQNDNNSVLIKADTTRNCTCKLSVINQDKEIVVNMQAFGEKESSSPLDYGCGLIMEFETKYGIVWEAQCKVEYNGSISTSIEFNDKMTIRSLSVAGTLKPNEGYCIEIKKGTY